MENFPRENSQEVGRNEDSEELSNEIGTARPHEEETSIETSTTIVISDIKCHDGLRGNEEGKCVGKFLLKTIKTLLENFNVF